MKTSQKLMVCVGAGVLITMAVFLYLKETERKIHAQQKMGKALIARRYVAAGKIVNTDDVEERAVPEAYIQPMALNTLKGEPVRARRGLIKGEQITRTNVYEEGALLGLGWTLAVGETAVSTRLPVERAAGGHIQPGDRVDVLCALDRQPGWDEPAAFALLSRARVVAVNDKVLDAPAENTAREVSNETILVTLVLPLESAIRLALAEERGTISLALTSPLDTGPRAVNAVTLRSFKK